MPDLLLELRSEEIPARMQRKAAGDFRKMVTDGLVEAGLTYEAAREYWTPRRLALDVRGLTARSKDVRDEIKGPSVTAPEAAIQGFLRKAGLNDVSEAHKHADPKKGEFYVAHIVKPGRAAEEIIAELVPSVIWNFPWPKSMRWGERSGPRRRFGAGFSSAFRKPSLRWVRPLQSIVCTFGPETSEPVVVDFEVDGIRSGNTTWGHRFHAPDAITVKRFDDYVSKLEAAKVVLDAERRKQMILSDAKNLAFASGLDLVEDEGLLEEVSGLVEWPVVLMGEFEADYLDIPAEVIRLTIRANQKCFVVRPSRPASPAPQVDEGELRGGAQSQAALHDGTHPEVRAERASKDALSNHFVLTANIEAKDGGNEIVHGNGKVVRARLSDALYFWKTDQSDLPDLDGLKESAEKFGLNLKKPLDQRMARLDRLGVTFHAKLGTQGERVERIARLAEELAPVVARAISPLAGEMGGSPEGGAVPPAAPSAGLQGGHSTLPPSALPGISPARGEITQLIRRAAVLAKADLQTEVVGEFPELQGAMGRKYALLQGEHPSVAAAIEEHYKPQGPSDRVPTDPVSVAVALADKLDTLVGFWAIDEKPTGSKDPYALRRAALGVIRIVLENGVRLRLRPVIASHCLGWLAKIDDYALSAPMIAYEQTESFEDLKALARASQKSGFTSSFVGLSPERYSEIEAMPERGFDLQWEDWIERINALTEWVGRVEEFRSEGRELETLLRIDELGQPLARWATALHTDLLAFFHDRLKVYLRDQGARHDLIDAVLATGVISPARGEIGQSSNDDVLMIVRRVEALGSFLDSEDGKNLLAGTKRAANILAAEEKKGTRIADQVDAKLFRAGEDETLASAVNQAENEAAQAIQNEDFSGAMRALSALREPVDSFFEKVLVNDPDEAVRANRLALLARIRAATGAVADFSKIAG